MKKILLIAASILFFAATTGTAAQDDDGWRCGNLFVKKGVQSFKIIEHCGEPISKEVVGYTDSGDEGGVNLTIEKWVYGPQGGYYYMLYLKGGVVDKVQSERVDY